MGHSHSREGVPSALGLQHLLFAANAVAVMHIESIPAVHFTELFDLLRVSHAHGLDEVVALPLRAGLEAKQHNTFGFALQISIACFERLVQHFRTLEGTLHWSSDDDAQIKDAVRKAFISRKQE